MPLSEDLSVFLNDFGVSCTAGAVSALGILDMPSQIISGDMVLSTDYTLTARAADFGGLLFGDSITVGGAPYQVRQVLKIDDGAFVEIALQKLLDFNNIITLSGLNLTTLAGDPLITL
jgi:hypothetical protein